MREYLADIKRRVLSFFYPPREKKYKKLIKKWYKKQTGEQIDFEDVQNFNQFIQWLKVYDNKPYKTDLTDKWKARDFIRNKIGSEYLTTLYGAYDDFDQIEFDKLPEAFVLKCNHGCGMNVIVKDKKIVDFSNLRKQFRKWMRTNFAFVHYPGVEPQYNKINHKIICEEFLGKNLIDIQFWCTRGEILFISYINDPHGRNKKATFDEKWHRLNFVTSKPENKEKILKPKRLAEMIKIAKRISSDMEFIRLDFYILENDDIKISEFTFTPANGLVCWSPSNVNREMYEKIQRIRDKK